MKYSVHNDRVVGHLEVDPAIIGAETIKCFAIAGEMAKAVAIEVAKIGLGDFKGIEQFELIERIHLGDFRRADFVEDNL